MTIRERCAQIAAATPPPAATPAPDPAPAAVEFDVLESAIDADHVTGACLTVRWQGRLVGSLGLRLREPGGFVHSLFVAAACRGRGLGEALLRLAADVAADHGKPTLGLSVHCANEPAQRLYRRLGFRPFAPTAGSDTSVTWVALLPLAEEASLLR